MWCVTVVGSVSEVPPGCPTFSSLAVVQVDWEVSHLYLARRVHYTKMRSTLQMHVLEFVISTGTPVGRVVIFPVAATSPTL